MKRISFNFNRVLYSFPENMITHIERNNRVSLLTIKNRTGQEKVFNSSLTLDEFERALSDDFVRIHESFLVNINEIISLSRSCVVLQSFHELPVSRSRYPEIRERFISADTDS